MAYTPLTGIDGLGAGLSPITNSVNSIGGLTSSKSTTKDDVSETSFDNLFQSALNLIKDTDDLSNKAEEEEIKYALGYDNTLELMVAQNKANIALQFTVAVRDRVVEGYKEIMNLQF